MADPIVLKWEERGLSTLIRAITDLNKSLARNEKQVKDTDKETRKHEKSQDALTKQARGTSKAMRAFGDAFSGVNAQAGRTTRTSGRLIGVFTNLSAVGGGAGVAVAGLAAGLALAGGAAIGAGAAIVMAAKNSRDLIDTLKPYQKAGLVPPVSRDVQASFDRIEGGFLATDAAAKALALGLAQEFAPAIEGATVGVVALTLAAADLAKAFIDTLSPIAEAFNGLSPMAKAALAVVAPTAVAAGELANFAVSLSTTTAEQGSYVDRARDMIGVATEQAAAMRNAKGAADAFAAGLKQLNERFAARAELATIVTDAESDLLSEEQKQAIAIDQRINKIRELGIAIGNEAEAEAAAQAIRDRAQRDSFNAFVADVAERRAVQAEADEHARASAAAFAEDVRAQQKMTQQAALSGATSVTDSLVSITSDLSSLVTTEGSRAALVMFKTQKAAGIAQATVSGFVAANKALELGPVAGPIAAGLIGAAAAANVAAIAAQQPPQVERHMGSPGRGASDPLAPDEMRAGNIRGLKQEAYTPNGVLSSQGVNALNSQRLMAAPTPSPGAVWKHLGREIPRRIDGGVSRTSASVRRAARREQSPGGQRGW